MRSFEVMMKVMDSPTTIDITEASNPIVKQELPTEMANAILVSDSNKTNDKEEYHWNRFNKN